MIKAGLKENKLFQKPFYFIFIGYLKKGGQGGDTSEPTNPLWIRHCIGK